MEKLKEALERLNERLSGFVLQFLLLANKYREYLSILAGVLIIMVLPAVLRYFDPSAAPIDSGVLEGVVYACVSIMIFKSLVWFLIRTIWPMFASYSNILFKSDFLALTPWQRIIVYLSFYLVLVVLLVVTLRAFI